MDKQVGSDFIFCDRKSSKLLGYSFKPFHHYEVSIAKGIVDSKNKTIDYKRAKESKRIKVNKKEIEFTPKDDRQQIIFIYKPLKKGYPY